MQKIIFYERQKIELYLRMGKTHRWISNRLNRDHTVISREIKRNSGNYLPYTASNAQRISDEWARKTNKRKIEVINKFPRRAYTPEEETLVKLLLQQIINDLL